MQPHQHLRTTRVFGHFSLPHIDPAAIKHFLDWKPVGTRIWVGDATNHNIPLSIRAVGEILIEGPTLSQGYLEYRRKTKSDLKQGVAWSKPSSRSFYKIGDIGYWTSQDSLAFSRRKDTTVKLRRVKVNLGDIEYAIKGLLPSACFVAVEVVKIFPVERKNEFIMIELKAHVSHMASKVIFPFKKNHHDSFEQNRSKTLRKMSCEIPRSQLAEYTTQGEKNDRPPTDLEAKMAELWERVLKLPTDSIAWDDSFLEVGVTRSPPWSWSHLHETRTWNGTVAPIFRQQRLSMLCSTILSIEPAPVVQTKTLEPLTLIDDLLSEKTCSARRDRCCLRLLCRRYRSCLPDHTTPRKRYCFICRPTRCFYPPRDNRDTRNHRSGSIQSCLHPSDRASLYPSHRNCDDRSSQHGSRSGQKCFSVATAGLHVTILPRLCELYDIVSQQTQVWLQNPLKRKSS